jgi:hypothetical protein
LTPTLNSRPPKILTFQKEYLLHVLASGVSRKGPPLRSQEVLWYWGLNSGPHTCLEGLYYLSYSTSPFLCCIFSFFFISESYLFNFLFIYCSYVHTMIGSFLPPAPTPSLRTRPTPSLSPPTPSLPGRNYFVLISNFVEEGV